MSDCVFYFFTKYILYPSRARLSRQETEYVELSKSCKTPSKKLMDKKYVILTFAFDDRL